MYIVSISNIGVLKAIFDLHLGRVKKGAYFASTVSYTRPPSPLDRATASLREGRCSPICTGGGDVDKEWCLPVDILSPGDSPSRSPCSRGWGTGAGPESPEGTVGG